MITLRKSMEVTDEDDKNGGNSRMTGKPNFEYGDQRNEMEMKRIQPKGGWGRDFISDRNENEKETFTVFESCKHVLVGKDIANDSEIICLHREGII